VWATADDIAFRFPRREIAVPGVEREMAILPELAAQLPAPIPDATYAGAPSAEFPWPWFGSRLIAGQEVALAGRAVDPMGRADMITRVPRARAVLGQVASLWDGAEQADAMLDTAESLTPDGDSVIVHGDLNQRHALVSESGGLAGVIDWGDMCRAPRSVDLPLYWSLFDARSRSAFRAAHGPLTETPS
jgi:aminoglycoside phosphotransferase (APT) family kinase protein